jgi:hypothetical protein
MGFHWTRPSGLLFKFGSAPGAELEILAGQPLAAGAALKVQFFGTERAVNKVLGVLSQLAGKVFPILGAIVIQANFFELGGSRGFLFFRHNTVILFDSKSVLSGNISDGPQGGKATEAETGK